jgi:GntR family transcriptional regulator
MGWWPNSRCRVSLAPSHAAPRSRRSTPVPAAYARLEEAGHVIASFVEHVGARMPTPDEVTTLQLDEGTPVITVTRVAYGPAGHPWR